MSSNFRKMCIRDRSGNEKDRNASGIVKKLETDIELKEERYDNRRGKTLIVSYRFSCFILAV